MRRRSAILVGCGLTALAALAVLPACDLNPGGGGNPPGERTNDEVSKYLPEGWVTECGEALPDPATGTCEEPLQPAQSCNWSDVFRCGDQVTESCVRGGTGSTSVLKTFVVDDQFYYASTDSPFKWVLYQMPRDGRNGRPIGFDPGSAGTPNNEGYIGLQRTSSGELYALRVTWPGTGGALYRLAPPDYVAELVLTPTLEGDHVSQMEVLDDGTHRRALFGDDENNLRAYDLDAEPAAFVDLPVAVRQWRGSADRRSVVYIDHNAPDGLNRIDLDSEAITAIPFPEDNEFFTPVGASSEGVILLSTGRFDHCGYYLLTDDDRIETLVPETESDYLPIASEARLQGGRLFVLGFVKAEHWSFTRIGIWHTAEAVR